ncbi:MAG: DUF883 C-terminal domain-containing protein [Trichloromonas sp.]|jgi:ElaB/YqjD/DUF883 family membrane-anchored ribosome-binding protein|nr:DUF883 C-terminal domain-containing protein [Trichloromonas sp.]
MGKNGWEGDKTEESVPDGQGRGKACAFDEGKAIVADRIRQVAEALGEKAAGQDARSGAAHYGKEASEWLDQSAEYVRHFDYKQADAKVREYVRQSPERSLLIAGAVGLIIGALWRRR